MAAAPRGGLRGPRGAERPRPRRRPQIRCPARHDLLPSAETDRSCSTGAGGGHVTRSAADLAEPAIVAESRNLVPNSMRVPAMAAMDVKAGSVTVTVRERDGREKVEEGEVRKSASGVSQMSFDENPREPLAT